MHAYYSEPSLDTAEGCSAECSTPLRTGLISHTANDNTWPGHSVRTRDRYVSNAAVHVARNASWVCRHVEA